MPSSRLADRPARRGSMLLVILGILLTLTVIVGALQFLSVDTIRQARRVVELTDSWHRAEGLVNLMLSRNKREIQYNTTSPLASPATGSESGAWDGERFVIGWERDAKPPRAGGPTHRMSYWIRLLDADPVRTFRHDVSLRTPSPLDPDVMDVLRITPEDVDPASAPQRTAAFARHPQPGPDEMVGGAAFTAQFAREARVEVLAGRIAELAAAGATPDATIAAVDEAALAGQIGTMRAYLQAHAAIAAANSDADAVTSANAARSAATSLGSPERGEFEQAARYAQARALATRALAEAGAVREATLQQAATILEDILRTGCCGDAMVAWKLAQIAMRRRSPLDDPSALVAARTAARQRLKNTVDVRPQEPIHDRTDIQRRELPDFLDQLWRARVAMAVEIAPTSHLLLSAREDGSAPVIHAESARPLYPQSFIPDGSQILAAAADPDGTPPTTSLLLWRMSLDGADLGRLLPGFYMSRGVIARTFTAESALLSVDWSAGGDILAFNAVGYQSTLSGSTLMMGTTLLGNAPSPSVVSPAGNRVAYLESGNTPNQWSLKISPVSAARLTGLPKSLGASFTDPTVATFTGLSANSRVTRLLWQRTATGGDEIVVPVRDPNGYRVRWFDGTGALLDDRSGTTPADVDPYEAGAANRRSALAVPQFAPGSPHHGHGGLPPPAPGVVLAARDRLVFVARTGTGAPDRDLPIDTAGRLSEIRFLDMPPWARFVFFQARLDGGAPSVFSLDLSSGRSTLVAGPGGTFPAAAAATQPAVSPVPEDP